MPLYLPEPPDLPLSSVAGPVIRQIRRRHGLSQMFVATRGGLDPKTVGLVERRAFDEILLSTVFKLARGIGVPASVIVKEIEDELNRTLGFDYIAGPTGRAPT